jgi:PAS domain S-box-containing protein
MRQPLNGETHSSAQPAAKESTTEAATRVLLVEDSPSDADLLQQTLQQAGAGRFEVTWVERLDDGLARLGEASFDVLLLDLSLPDSSGPETFRRALHAAPPQLAIVVLTGASDESVGLAAVQEGVQDYLIKGQADGRQIARAIWYAIERKHAREQLRQQGELLRVTLASIGDAVLATDTAGRITFLNPIAAGLTGWPEEQALGQPVQHVFQIINEQTRQSAEDIVGRVLREGRVVSLANHTALLARDGREIPIEDSAAPIRDGAGEVAGAVLVFRDVTGTRRAQMALRDSESRLHSLSDNLPEGAIYRYCQSIDGKPHFEFLSAGIERLTGIPAAELMGGAETAEMSIMPEDRDRLRAAIALSREKLTQFEVAVRHKHRTTGEVRWSLLRSTPTRDPDGSTMWDGIALDITERERGEEALRESRAKLAERTLHLERTAAELEKRNREVERVNRMKTEFLSRSSHELRTPLNAIIGYSDLLGEQSAGPLPPPYPRFVANIQEGARHLLAMVNDLLDISRIETGHIELNREAFRPAQALEEVVLVVAPLAKIKNIAVDNQVPAGMTIRADRTRFKQVLYNLLSNAVKFTPENGRVWIAEASREDAAGFCVGDTGIGIPESELEAIFDEFHQVSGSSGSVTEGTGLGLAIARRLVELHGGAIRVESTIGQGSRFILSLGADSLEHPDDGTSV